MQSALNDFQRGYQHLHTRINFTINFRDGNFCE